MAVQIEEELSFSDYVSILKRRWLAVLITTFIIIVAAVVTAVVLPSVYTSEGTINIESPVISLGMTDDDAAIYINERLDKLKGKILSKDNLVRMKEKFGLLQGIANPEDVERIMRNSIAILYTEKSVDGTQWGKKVTAGFNVRVDFSDAENAYKIANDITSQLLEENAKDRHNRASVKTEFLTTQLSEIKAGLEVVENKVAEYKRKHSGSLPEHMTMHMTMLDDLRKTSENLDRDYKATQEELRYLDVEYTTLNASISNAEEDEALQVVSPLEKAQAELERSLVLYKDTHPTVRALKRKVALLESTGRKPAAPTAKSIESEIALSKIKTTIEAAKARLSSISVQKRSVLADLAKLRKQVTRIPEVERGLATLLRDYEHAKKKYQDVKSKQVNAKIAGKLESENKAERFILKESPEIPKYRTSPQRKLIVAGGVPAGLTLGLILAMLLEFLDKRVRGLNKITLALNAKPIAIIPNIETKEDVRKKQSVIKYAYIVGIALVALIVAAAIVYLFVMPSK